MNVLEDKLRTALRETGEEITPDSVPPLRRPSTRRGTPRAGRGRWSAWLTPVAAAASVAAVIAASLAISATFHGHTPAPRGATSGKPYQAPPAPTGALAGVPSYFAELTDPVQVQAQRAVVRSTVTGSTLATVAPAKPYRVFTWVSGAADDKTFILAAQRWWNIGPGQAGLPAERRDNTTPTVFFRLTFNPATGATQLRRLAIPQTFPSSQVAGMAVSPDGTRLAVDLRQSIQVINTSTGSARTWTAAGPGWVGNNKPTGQPMTWAANSRTLAFQQHTGAEGQTTEVSLLNTATPGGSLSAASKVALTVPRDTATGALAGDTLLTPDGARIVAATTTQHSTAAATHDGLSDRQAMQDVIRMRAEAVKARRTGKPLSDAFKRLAARVRGALDYFASHTTTTQAITEFSVTTGKPVRVLDRQSSGYQNVLWTNTSGSTMLIVSARPGSKAGTFTTGIGVLTGKTLTPLPQLGPVNYAPLAW